ncbi:MAG: DUF1553 domain-containing protein, partial [Amaricoccus sp.]|uniref:DUF1553 domain-containing protein n=1 Tax=Amaricoccus sp. TaxID=1872485 RepID=UPI003315F11B
MDIAAILAFWALAAWAFFGPNGGRLIHAFFVSLPFGSFAVLSPGVTGGLTLTPTPMVALLILLRCLVRRGGLDALLTEALARRRMLLLFLFWVVAALITAFMPRVMAGRVDIIPFRGEMLGATPLRPTAQNVSQFAYLTISVFVAFAFAVLLRAPGMRQCALRALNLGALATVITGALDFASTWLPLTPLLDPFRTATYALLVTHEVLGAKRVVGLMPEASAFGSLAVGLLAMLWFFRRAIADRRLREVHAPVLMILLAVLVWRSTSTTAYVALGLLGLLAALEWCWRALAARRGAGPGDENRPTYLLKRGDWLKPGNEVSAGVPAFLHPLPPGAEVSRLTFARWLVDRRSPTTARALVNRVWLQYFGAGLVETPEDLGTQSPAPSHPALLDWLAVEFMEPTVALPGESRAGPWSWKHLHRLIVHSATYRRSSRVTPDLLARDPSNRLLARGPRVRVEGEV